MSYCANYNQSPNNIYNLSDKEILKYYKLAEKSIIGPNRPNTDTFLIHIPSEEECYNTNFLRDRIVSYASIEYNLIKKKNKNTKLNNKNTELNNQNKNTELNNKNTELNNKNTELNNKNTELNNKNTELNNKNTELNNQNKNTELNNKNTELKKQVKIAKNALNNISLLLNID
jgi:hypothetical protein